MKRTIRIFQVDAFTEQRFAGNPAGVVLDAQCLSAAEMQAIARELNNGDTAFVLPADAPDHDIQMRFFTPRKEAPFVGHATLAAHAVLALSGHRALTRQRGQTGIVEVRRASADAAFSIRQAAPELGRSPTLPELSAVLEALGLQHSQLDEACPTQIVGTASTRLLIGVQSLHALDTAVPDLPRLKALSAQIGAQGYFLFARTAVRDQCHTTARMFCPALGIDEDPVSGNAHGMLGVYLVKHGLLPLAAGRAQFNGAQGDHVKRPGVVGVEIEADAAGKPTAVSISGQAIVLFEAAMSL
jgi:PhzF family phenazine biosynthesis protein